MGVLFSKKKKPPEKGRVYKLHKKRHIDYNIIRKNIHNNVYMDGYIDKYI